MRLGSQRHPQPCSTVLKHKCISLNNCSNILRHMEEHTWEANPPY